jgi:peptidoglycan hydrolase-like protein with peptidoglycan-binding domain
VQSIKRADHGEPVRDAQARLTALGFHIDGTELEAHAFGESTEASVRAFQQERGLLVDGLLGPVSWEELVEAGYALGDRVLYLRRPPFRGDDVRALQRRLNLLGFDPGREDGIFGDQTATAARDFQLNVGLRPDGIVGATTTQALDRLLAAPVSGNAKVIKAGKLTFVVSGPKAAYDMARPYLDMMGTGSSYVGEGELARIAKICHNVMLGVVIQNLCEITILAQKAGMPRHAFLDFLNKSVMGSMFTRYKTPALVNLDFKVTFTPHLLRKDLDLGLDAGHLGRLRNVEVLA